MTTMLPDLDEQTIEDIAVPCEATWTLRDAETDAPVRKNRCEQNADWVVRTTCHCGHVEIDLLCDDHYQRAMSGDPFWRFVCTACMCRSRYDSVQAEPL